MTKRIYRQDLFRVWAFDHKGAGCSWGPIDCNAYQLPGVLWALQSMFPTAEVHQQSIGRGTLNPDTRKGENLKHPKHVQEAFDRQKQKRESSR